MKKLLSIFVVIIFLTNLTNVESVLSSNMGKKVDVYIFACHGKNSERHVVKISENRLNELRDNFLYMGERVANMNRNTAVKFMRMELESLFMEFNISLSSNIIVPHFMPYVVVGDTTNTLSTGSGWLSSCWVMDVFDGIMFMVYQFLHSHGIYYFSHLLFLFIILYTALMFVYYFTAAIPSYVNPLPLLGSIFIGCTVYPFFGPSYHVPGKGWVYTVGFDGVEKYEGNMYGDEDFFGAPLPFAIFYPAIFGFTGIAIWIPKNETFEHLYAGFALDVNISSIPPSR